VASFFLTAWPKAQGERLGKVRFFAALKFVVVGCIRDEEEMAHSALVDPASFWASLSSGGSSGHSSPMAG
jgi:hypothetical protein